MTLLQGIQLVLMIVACVLFFIDTFVWKDITRFSAGGLGAWATTIVLSLLFAKK